MALSRRTGRSRLTLALLVLTSLALLTLDFRDSTMVDGARRAASTVFSPLRGVAETATEPLSNAWNGVAHYGDIEAENRRLRAELEQRTGDAVRDADAAEQLDELLGQLEIDWVGDVPTATARVIAGPGSNFSHTIEIDKGADDGFKVGMPVITGAGLAGKLVQVTGSRSMVMLITDPEFAVGVRLVTDGATGTARGRGEGENLVVDTGLESAAEVSDGAALTTSGTDRSAFPAFIPVGTVVRTREGPGGLTLDLVIEPLADTERLGFVTVMLWEPAE
ncbi:MAG: rod shape-determining protein MreC [Acidimicrobiales bacterium]